MQPLRVWYLLRTLDQDASGRWGKAKALAHLRCLGRSQASAYRLISKGMGTFWREETTYPHGRRGQRGTSPRKTLVLVGTKALAEDWGLEQLPRRQVEVPWELCVGDMAAWNSLAYHAWLPGPRLLRITRSGVVRKPLPNHPYSRAKIRQDTGISERTQIRYQELLLPGSRRKVTPKKANYATHQEELRSKRHWSWGTEAAGEQLHVEPGETGMGAGKGVQQGAERVSAPCA